MQLKRNLSLKLLRLLELFPIVAVLGVRQAGKTELVKTTKPNWQYFDLERENDFQLISRDTLLFFERYKESIIIDEAQEYPELFRNLRSVVDLNRDKKGRFILTGSSSPELLKNISESLAGRIAIIELGTLKMNEFFQCPLSKFYDFFDSNEKKEKTLNALEPTCTQNELFSFWFRGGYPEPILTNDSEFYNTWMENYFATYINRDIRKLFPRLDAVRFRRLINVLANISGNIINKKDIAAVVEVSEPTIKDYLDIAAGTFIWRNLSSFEHQIKKAVIKMPKGHLRDTGLMHYLLKISSEEELFANPIVGRSFESFVIEEIIKGVNAKNITNWSYYYYRTRAKSEIDLILHGPFGVIPIEIKFGKKMREQSINTLKNFIKEHKLPFGFLINNGDRIEELASNIYQIPAHFL